MKLQCVAAGLLFAGSLSAADKPSTTNHFTIVDEIVAKVNGDIVSRDELQRLGHELEQELKAQGDSGPRLEQDVQAQEKNVLRDRIDQLLLVQKGKELNINVDTEVAKYFADLQRRANHPGEENQDRKNRMRGFIQNDAGYGNDGRHGGQERAGRA